jgi:hypothetical protein
VIERHLKPADARGKLIREGSRVRVVGIPDLSGIKAAAARRDVERVFRHILGHCKTVAGFSRRGMVELVFRIRSGTQAGWHVVEIEPHLLLVQRGRKLT